ncbi:hypothetical protein LAZ67_15002210 [Cordylochernes scorpioides]|uniref:Transposase n=1 Tax=Cordylochernes scorpioides TaxID=51811 RepID=A0ABY6L9G4_9ARAC|nr:hypothetical protein LAZ67_15002210 [Cordylochernes scorpioides]
MEAPLKDCTTLEQRAVIRFLNAEGIQTSQICQRMKNIYADNLNISYGTVHTIIKEQLQFRKICCRWIPHFLNLDQKLNRIRVSKSLLKWYEEEGDHFIDQIVTGNESWCYHYDPSTKRASMEWKRGDSPRPKKKKNQVSTFGRQRMNSDLHCDILVNKLKPGIRNKRRGKLSKGVLFLHDNARPHTSSKTVFTIIKLGFEVLEHPAYSPDLAPSDYFLFGLLKKELKEKRFDSDEDVQKVVQDFFHTIPKSAYKEGIYKLPERWRRCIESQGIFQHLCGMSLILRNKPFWKFYIGPKPIVLLHKPESAEILLSSAVQVNKAFEYSFLLPWLKEGLITSAGYKWKARRKMITPSFHFRILEDFVPVFNEQSMVLVNKLAATEGTQVDIVPLMSLCALDIICERQLIKFIQQPKLMFSGHVMYGSAGETLLTVLEGKLQGKRSRGRAIGLKEAGWSNGLIARHLCRSDAAIRRCWQEWVNNGRLQCQDGSGRSRDTTEREDRAIVRTAVTASDSTLSTIQRVTGTHKCPKLPSTDD